jgi:hypothetical protein
MDVNHFQKESGHLKSSNSNGIISFGNLGQCHWCKSCDIFRSFDTADDDGCPLFHRDIDALELLTEMPASNTRYLILLVINRSSSPGTNRGPRVTCYLT